MLIFFDIIMGLQRLADLEGAEFDNIEVAHAEARTIASDIIIEELRRGGNVGVDWRIDERGVAGTILAQVLFYEVVFEPIANSYTATSLRRHLLGDPFPIPSYHRSMATVAEARAIAANVRNIVREIKPRLD
jgi:hypothetical protein